MIQPEQKPEQQPNRNQRPPSSEPLPEADQSEFTGSAEASYKAATAGVTELTPQDHTHPTKIYHAREETGRHADQGKDK